MTTTAIEMPQTNEIESQSLTLTDQAKAIKIRSHPDYERAGAFLISCKRLIKEIKDTFDKPKKLAKATHASICDAENKHLGPVEEAVAMIGQAMGTFLLAEEKKKREQEEQIRKEAEAREAEARRLIEDERLKTAAKLDEIGESEAAMDVLAQPIVVSPPLPFKPLKEAPKAAGVSARKRYVPIITNEALLPRAYLTPDHQKIKRVVDAMGLQANIPGVSVREEFSMAGRLK